MTFNFYYLVLILLVLKPHSAKSREHLLANNTPNGQKTSLYTKREIASDFSEIPPDDDLLALSAGSINKYNKKKEKSTVNDSEEKKTLAQQVAEGKYALIQNELFLKPPKRPGILSYEANSDIPNDTVHSLGGLGKKEIWLADGHLLVLTGGTFQPYEATDGRGNTWRPIDIYKAPKRPVKLPTRPKVPPPFPVQLVEDGPLQILGTNFTRTLNESEKTFTPVPPSEGYIPGSGPYFPPTNQDSTNPTSGQSALRNPSGVTETIPTPISSLNSSNLPPHFASLPPGAVVLPPPNLTDMTDDDDSSIYYPPPYSFYYEIDNSTKVPPGPLVPGLILPPPPNFFAPLETTTAKTMTTKSSTPPKTSYRFRMKNIKKNETSATTTTTPRISSSTISSKTKQLTNRYNRPMFRARNKTSPRPVTIPQFYGKTESQVTKNPTIVSSHLIEEIHIKTVPDVTTPSYREVQIKKVKQTSTPNSLYDYKNDPGSSKVNYKNSDTISTTKRLPVKIYITPSYNNDNLPKYDDYYRTKRPKNVYYFEEKPKYHYTQTTSRPEVPLTTLAPDVTKHSSPPVYYTTSQSPPPLLRQIQLSPAPDSDSSFKQHIDQIRNHIQKFQTNQDRFVDTGHQPQPVYEYSFQANNYQQQHQINEDRPQQRPRLINNNKKYTVKIQPAIEITSPVPNIRQSSHLFVTPQEGFRSTPRPIVDDHYERHPEESYRTRNNINIIPPYPFFDVLVYDLQSRRELQSPEQNLAWQRRLRKPVNLLDDINVNYHTKNLQIHPEAELIQVPQQSQLYSKQAQNQRPGYYDTSDESYPQERRQNPASAFISYKLPGDEEAHVYFLTPQQIKQQNQDISYYYKGDNRNDQVN